MPFRKKARITLENINNAEEMRLYYQINYTLTEVPEDEGYFHAQFRRSNPTQGSIHTLVDGIKGKGQYVGTYLAWRPSVEQVRRIISAVRITSRIRKHINTKNSPLLMRECTK